MDYELQKNMVGEKSIEIENLQTQIAELNKLNEKENLEKEKVIQEKDKEIEKRNLEIREKDEELEKYREQEREREKKKRCWEKRKLFVRKILIRLIIIVIVSVIAYLVTKNIKEDLANKVGFLITIITTLLSGYAVIKKDYKDIFCE